MSEDTPAASGRRHVFDGTFTVVLLALAVGQGYFLLAPTSSPARIPPSTVNMVVTPERTAADRPTGPIVPTSIAPTETPAPPPPAVASVPPPVSTPPAVNMPSPPPAPITPAVPSTPPPAVRGEWPAKVTGRVLGPDAAPAAGVFIAAG